MFDNMSENVKTILTEKSRQIAFSMKHEKIHPEHMMMALFDTPDAIATKYLKQRFELVRFGPELAALVMAIPVGAPKSADQVGFSDQSKKVVDQMLVEARELGSSVLGTEHLLMSLVMNHEPIRKILKEKFDVTYGQIREALKPAPAAPAEDPMDELPTTPEAPGTPGAPKTVRVSPIMGAVFFDAKLNHKEIELALLVIENIKGVRFTQPMAVPPDMMGDGSEILKGRFKDPAKPR